NLDARRKCHSEFFWKGVNAARLWPGYAAHGVGRSPAAFAGAFQHAYRLSKLHKKKAGLGTPLDPQLTCSLTRQSTTTVRQTTGASFSSRRCLAWSILSGFVRLDSRSRSFRPRK